MLIYVSVIFRDKSSFDIYSRLHSIVMLPFSLDNIWICAKITLLLVKVIDSRNTNYNSMIACRLTCSEHSDYAFSTRLRSERYLYT